MKLPLFILIFAILLPIAYAAPPFQDTQLSTSSLQLEIIYPKFPYWEKGKDFIIHIHAFNSSGISFNGTNTDCFIHFYNKTGGHIIKSQMDDDGFDFNYTISGNIIDVVGSYSYLMWCNASGVGGFISENIEITNSGRPTNSAQDPPLFLIIIPIFIALFMLVVSWMLDNEKYPMLKIGLILLGFVIIFQIYHVATVVVSDFYNRPYMSEMLGDFTFTYSVIMWTIFSIFIITFIYDLFMLFGKKKYKTGDYDNERQN